MARARPLHPEQGPRLPRALRACWPTRASSRCETLDTFCRRDFDPRRPSRSRQGAGRRGLDRRARPRPLRSASAWRSPPACGKRDSARLRGASATARSTRARCGRRRCAPASTGSPISRCMVDYNKIQSAGPTREIQDLEPLADKWRAFGFAAVEVDGHDVAALRRRASRAAARRRTGRAPSSATPSRARAFRSPRTTPTGTTRAKIGGDRRATKYAPRWR